jgi:hypothetical protein
VPRRAAAGGAPGSAAGRLSNLVVMRRHAARTLLARYAVTWIYLAAVTATEIFYAALPGRDQVALLAWASTNVHNLQHDPVGSLVVSAFLPAESGIWWPGLIALGLFGANKVLGNWRTAAVCAAAHIAGTLVSEGIQEYRITQGFLPVTARYIIDVGPSYVLVAAITVAILYGGRLARAAALLDLALLIFVGDIFGGLREFQVAAVGHVTAIAVGAIGGSLARWQRRRGSASQAGTSQARTSQARTSQAGTSQAAADREAADREAPGSRADQAAQPRPPA